MAKSREIITSHHKDHEITATNRGYTIFKDAKIVQESVTTDDPKSVNNNADPDTNVQRAKLWIDSHV